MNALFAVRRCPDWHVKGVIVQDHYLQRWPDPRSLPFAYCLTVDGEDLAGDGRPFGCCVFSLLQHHSQRNLFGWPGLPTCWQVLNLARVWVHPELQKTLWLGFDRQGHCVQQSPNAFSRMVSLCLRRVQADWLKHHPPVYPHLPYHIELIVSYCDRVHHQGTGYRAASFRLWGATADGTKDVYVRWLRRPRWQWEPRQLSLMEVTA